MAFYYDYVGVIHVHSTYSDGLKDVKEIVSAAREARCDYIIISDHDTLKALADEGYYGKTVLLVGEEITVVDNLGHYLAMRLSYEAMPKQGAQQTIDEVANQGGIGVIAHPFDESMGYLFKLTPVTWKVWSVHGFNGLEIWNYSQDWLDGFEDLISYPLGILNPDLFIGGPLAATLKKWDELLQKRRVVGIGSVDAHGYFYSYRRMFKTVRTHVILDTALSFEKKFFNKDKNKIYTALEKGNCYLSYDYLADARGFMYLANDSQTQVSMGEEISLKKEVSFKVSAPRQALLRLIKDGEIVASAFNSKSLSGTINKPGVYRAEAFLYTRQGIKKGYRPWIFSNPIYVI